MYIFLTYETLVKVFESWGFDITVFTVFEKCVVLLLSNILFVLILIFILSCIWKVINRVLRIIF